MSKLNILLVDDNAIFRQAAHALLAGLSCVGSVECTNSAAEALARIDQLNPHLVLTDIMMPVMSGFELIRKLRTRDAPLRIIAVTLHDSSDYRTAVRRSGADGLVSKREFGTIIPPMIEELARSLKSACVPQ